MQFADFHVHGNFKTYFTGYEVKDKENPWNVVNIFVDNFLFRKSNRIFSSQSCFRQLDKGSLGIGVMPLYSTERAFPDSFLLKLMDMLTDKINKRLFKEIRDRKLTNFHQLGECYQHLLQAVPGPPDRIQSVNLTRTFSDLQDGHMNVVFSLEGAHAFLDRDEDVLTTEGLQKITDRVRLYKKKDPDDPNPRIFILNPTHLTKTPFVNHAFGIKIISHADFIPQDSGISPAGMQLLHAAMQEDDEHYPMIIDVKHMSLSSRRVFYQFRRTHYPQRPMVYSHAGCTGISWDRAIDYVEKIHANKSKGVRHNLVCHVKPDGFVPQCAFNPWTINLYDEDIAELLLSGGLIGLSLDQRILGAGNVAREKMSTFETLPGILTDHPLVVKDPDEELPIPDPELHFRHFCNNLFHIINVGRRTRGPSDAGWRQIVIASDFDGLINAVDFCTTGQDYRRIADYMRDKLPAIAAEAGFVMPAPLEDIIDGLLYRNGYRFLEKYY